MSDAGLIRENHVLSSTSDLNNTVQYSNQTDFSIGVDAQGFLQKFIENANVAFGISPDSGQTRIIFQNNETDLTTTIEVSGAPESVPGTNSAYRPKAAQTPRRLLTPQDQQTLICAIAFLDFLKNFYEPFTFRYQGTAGLSVSNFVRSIAELMAVFVSTAGTNSIYNRAILMRALYIANLGTVGYYGQGVRNYIGDAEVERFVSTFSVEFAPVLNQRGTTAVNCALSTIARSLTATTAQEVINNVLYPSC